VVAHVHHVQDIVAGGLIGLVAAVLGLVVWHAVRRTTAVQRAAGVS
jgi:membrane-associated phospholipid phosphatase